MKIQPQEKILLLGASRGLGLAVHSLLKKHSEGPELYSFSRKMGGMDFSKRELWEQHCENLWSNSPRRLIYFAGGGPYGTFDDFSWKDHGWALNVSFTFPAFLLHSALQAKKAAKKNDSSGEFLQQLIFIGSAVAENKPDPKAAMYCAAKHALRGLVSTIQMEQPKLDLRLFSPGYMDTAMLPPQAWPRQKGLAQKVDDVAADLINFMTHPAPKFDSLD
ncbi:MAG: SDR family oxidoreductase [Bdellovibrionota bacterium]